MHLRWCIEPEISQGIKGKKILGIHLIYVQLCVCRGDAAYIIIRPHRFGGEGVLIGGKQPH